MRWAIGALLALGFSLAASAALACPYPHGCRPDAAYEGQAVDSANDIFDARRYDQGGNLYTDDRYGPGYDEPYDDAGLWASPWYRPSSFTGRIAASTIPPITRPYWALKFPG